MNDSQEELIARLGKLWADVENNTNRLEYVVSHPHPDFTCWEWLEDAYDHLNAARMRLQIVAVSLGIVGLGDPDTQRNAIDKEEK